MAGYFVGDGCCKIYPNKGYPTPTLISTITCPDPNEGIDIEHCVSVLGWKFKKSPPRKGTVAVWVYNVSGGSRPWLYKTGLAGHGSHTKRVPPFVFEGSRKQIGHFIGAYFACDGTLNKKGSLRTDLNISFSSVNRLLLTDVQHLLLRLGIKSRIRKKVGIGFGKPVTSYNLDFSSQDDTSKFITDVPVFGVKSERLKQWAIKRREFDRRYMPDPIISIESSGKKECRCLTVEDDHSFLIEDIAVHNSLLIAVLWPAWIWTSDPQWRGMFGSYSTELAIRDSVRCRDLMQSQWYQETFTPGWKFSSDQNVKSYFTNTVKGLRIALGVTGRGTGYRAQAVICDDPIKADDAYSEASRLRAIRWWDGTMSSRLTDPRTGSKVIVMQRLHEDDLSGHVLRQGGYEHLCLPSEFEVGRQSVTSIGGDPRTTEGELLFPSLFPESVLRQARKDMGSAVYAGQHQQRPAPAEGGIIKRHWFKAYDNPPANGDTMIQSWDMSFKDSAGSDYVVGQIWARVGANYYLLEQVRERLDFPGTVVAFKRMCARWPKATAKYIEDKANGPAVIATLRNHISGIIAWNPKSSKEARIHSVSALFEAGNVYVPNPAHNAWVRDYIDELCTFPNGSHDDMVDATSMSLLNLAQSSFFGEK
ncbi:MAG: hypothetical protein NVS1B11_36340 [Terriglobales bacterium]